MEFEDVTFTDFERDFIGCQGWVRRGDYMQQTPTFEVPWKSVSIQNGTDTFTLTGLRRNTVYIVMWFHDDLSQVQRDHLKIDTRSKWYQSEPVVLGK